VRARWESPAGQAREVSEYLGAIAVLERA